MSHPTSSDCCVCLERPKTDAFDPCGHRCVCGQCARQILASADPKCPICRKETTRTIRIFDDRDDQAPDPALVLALAPPAPPPPAPPAPAPTITMTTTTTTTTTMTTTAPVPEPSPEPEPAPALEPVPEPAPALAPTSPASPLKYFSVEVENLYDPENASEHGGRICPYLILGCCISVKWAEHWHQCYVLSYHEGDGTHKCRYHGGRNGGQERTYHLNRKKFLVVSVPPSLLDSRLRNIELSKEYAKRVGAVPKPQFLVQVHYQYDPNRYSQRLDNYALVGCQIGLRWTSGEYHTCQVQSYNSQDGTHTCVYSSGRRRHLHLNRCHFVMVSTFQQQSISLTGPPPTKDEVCPKTQMVDIMQARPWADVVPPKEPTRYPLL